MRAGSGTLALPVLESWSEFVATAAAPDSIPNGSGRSGDAGWAGATWREALVLARDGWTARVPEVDLAIAELRARSATTLRTDLVPVADVVGSEVDVAAYLAGVPECMVDAELAPMSRHGRVVTFLVPATYSCIVPHEWIVNRGKALCVLGAAIVAAGHSVEVWSGYACENSLLGRRCAAVTRVISAGEPFDPARLMFAMAHPAMLRRLWFAVWDSAERSIAATMPAIAYGSAPYSCAPDDLPPEITEAYVFPSLDHLDRQWASWDTALTWSVATFAELGLVAGAA